MLLNGIEIKDSNVCSDGFTVCAAVSTIWASIDLCNFQIGLLAMTNQSNLHAANATEV